MLRSPFARKISSSTKLSSNIYKGRKAKSSDEYKKSIEKCIAPDCDSLPAVIKRGKGVHLYDVEGRSYLDFCSGHSSVALGHGHPKLCKVLYEQARRLAHTSRDMMNAILSDYGEYITELFCYDKVLPASTGSEACQAAMKLAMEWGYKCKGICANRAKVLFAENNYYGQSLLASDSGGSNFDTVPFNDSACLDCKAKDPNVCAFMIEPIQGNAGIIIPDPCYLKCVRELCTRHKILFIADEVQCGLGRTGCMLCCDLYRVRPDILVLGKALSAGLFPVSAVLTDAEIMDLIERKPQGGTFGGSALGCKIAMEALKTIQEENVIENSRQMGEVLRGALCDLPKDIVCEIRGVGLMNAIVLNSGINARDVSLDLMNHGLLAKWGKGNIIRLCPPLNIKENEIMKATRIIRHCIENSRGNCDGDGNCQDGIVEFGNTGVQFSFNEWANEGAQMPAQMHGHSQNDWNPH